MQKQPRNGDIIKSFKREINLQTRVVKDRKKYNRKEKHKMKFKDFISESLMNEGDELRDFQMTYDDRLASVSAGKVLVVKYFQRYRIKAEDENAVKELAKKLKYRGELEAEGQTLKVSK